MEYTDEEKSVLEIKFEDGSKLYLNRAMYFGVADPQEASRYYPLSDVYPEREKARDQDLKWMRGSFEAELSFVPYLQACEEYKKIN